MLCLVIKAFVSAIIIVIVSETARRNPGTGALIASLPLISVLGMIWLWRDGRIFGGNLLVCAAEPAEVPADPGIVEARNRPLARTRGGRHTNDCALLRIGLVRIAVRIAPLIVYCGCAIWSRTQFQVSMNEGQVATQNH
jgi:hypothetical protein